MLTFDDAKTGLVTLAKMAATVTGMVSYAKPMNLADAGKLLRIEPRVIVAPDCLNYTNISAIMQSLNSIYSACWLTAADVLFKVDNCRTIRNLDRLNPNRDATGFLLLGQAEMRFEQLRREGYKHSLPTHDLFDSKVRMEGVKRVSLRQEKHGDNEANLQDFVNLSVGRQLEVDISSEILDGKMVERKIMVNVRLKATSTAEEVIVAILTGGNIPRGWGERWRALMAGELNFVADGIFMHDIYRERMRLGVLDRDGLQKAILTEANNNKRYGVLTQAPSLADASNMFVISTDTVNRELRAKIGGSLTDAGARKKVFNVCPVMVIAEIDREKNQTRFYVRGESDYALVKDSDMKDFKSKAPDVMEIFNALQTSSFNRF